MDKLFILLLIVQLDCVNAYTSRLDTFLRGKRNDVTYGDERTFDGRLYQVTGNEKGLFSPEFRDGETFDVHLFADNDFMKMSLQRGRSVAHPDCMIGVRSGTGDDVIKFAANKSPEENCNWYGNVPSHGGKVVFNNCGPKINGFVMTTKHAYSVVMDKDHIRMKRDADEAMHVTVTKRDIDDIATSADHEDTADILGEPDENDSKQRTTNNSITIETAVYLDAGYNEKLENNGLVTIHEKFNAMMLKYQMVAVLLGFEDQLGYQITLSVKYFELWITNPSYYKLDITMKESRNSFCQNVRNENTPTYDMLTLHSGQDDTGSNVKGLAVVGSVCTDNNCLIERTGILQPLILAHETGHVLGMLHNDNLKCMQPGMAIQDGIMESPILSWNDCNKAELNNTVSSGKDCLYAENVTVAGYQHTSTNVSTHVIFSGKLPGQQFTSDQICKLVVGERGFFREFPRKRTACKKIVCISETNGVPVVHEEAVVLGKYCAEQKICMNIWEKCENLNNTGVAHKEVIQGGWSDFGPWSGCTRTCGTGVQYRKRDCTNPVPQNAPFCEGDQYIAHLCNMEPCTGESSNITELIENRRGAACAAINEAIHVTFTAATKGHKQCEVECTTRTVLLPYGTPCGGENDREFCIEGYCREFNSVWQSTTDLTIPGEGNKELLLKIPAESTDIDISFNWNDMINNYLEIRTKGDITALSPAGQVLYSTGQNPINFANCYWYYESNDKGIQYLRTETGTAITEPAFIWLHQKKAYTNNGITISFASRLDGLCVEIACQNNGVWNSALCSCDCQPDFYGQTCSSVCGMYCFNGVVIDEITCTCPCDVNVTYGDNCRCQEPFTGKDCTACQIPEHSLENNCRIPCIAGCGGLDCTDSCEDAATTLQCEKRQIQDKCSYSKTERQCQLTCGYCIALPVQCGGGKTSPRACNQNCYSFRSLEIAEPDIYRYRCGV